MGPRAGDGSDPPQRRRPGTVPAVTAFYVAGGGLAAWAVVVALVGLTRPGFPASRGTERAVVTISVLLVALAIGTGIAGAIFESAHKGDAAVSVAVT